MGLPAWRARKERGQLVLPAQSVLLDLPVRRVTRENLAINKNPTAKAAGGIRPVAQNVHIKIGPRHAYQPPWAAKTLAVATTRLRRPFFSDQRTVVTSPLAGAAARLACLASNSPSCRAGIFRAIARRATPREIVKLAEPGRVNVRALQTRIFVSWAINRDHGRGVSSF